MGLMDRLFGWKDYYDHKFDEFLNTIKEGFKLRDDRISRLEFEIKRPVVQPVVQEVNVKKQQLLELIDELPPLYQTLARALISEGVGAKGPRSLS